jgi:hypothetical protein
VRAQRLIACLSLVAVVACRAAAPAQRREQQLKDSFVQQIASTGIVRDLQRNGDSLSFTARYGNDLEAKWRVQIDSATIDPQRDSTTNDKGLIRSSWYVNGGQIRPRGDQSDLPLAFLDNGLAQECWALWDSGRREWSWK